MKRFSKYYLGLALAIVLVLTVGGSAVYGLSSNDSSSTSKTTTTDTYFLNASTTQGYSQVFNASRFGHVAISMYCSGDSINSGTQNFVTVQVSSDQTNWVPVYKLENICANPPQDVLETSVLDTGNSSIGNQYEGLTHGLYYRVYNQASYSYPTTVFAQFSK